MIQENLLDSPNLDMNSNIYYRNFWFVPITNIGTHPCEPIIPKIGTRPAGSFLFLELLVHGVRSYIGYWDSPIIPIIHILDFISYIGKYRTNINFEIPDPFL